MKLFLKPLYRLYEIILFKKIRGNFRRKTGVFIGGSITRYRSPEVFFMPLGSHAAGYGLTEASPVISSNVLKRHKLGSSGNIVQIYGPENM
jgi:long-chain acyl-CoA synthetase